MCTHINDINNAYFNIYITFPLSIVIHLIARSESSLIPIVVILGYNIIMN